MPSDRCSSLGYLAGQAHGDRWTAAHGFVEAGLEVLQIFDLVVVEAAIEVGGYYGLDFLAQLLHDVGVTDQEEHGVGHCSRGCILLDVSTCERGGSGVNGYIPSRDKDIGFSENLAVLEVSRDSLVAHKILEEVTEGVWLSISYSLSDLEVD
jgi:hypothetical protein